MSLVWLLLKKQLFVVYVLICLLGGKPRLNTEMYASSETLQSTLQTLHDEERWIEFWNDVAAGKNIPINSNAGLPQDVQRVAFRALQWVIWEDLVTGINFKEAKLNETIYYIFDRDTVLYWKAYVELAAHAHFRNPRIGVYMYQSASSRPEVLKEYPKVSQLYVLYYGEKYSDAIPVAEELANDKSERTTTREFALIMKLKSQVKLEPENGCLAVRDFNSELLQTQKYKEMLLTLAQDCHTSSTT